MKHFGLILFFLLFWSHINAQSAQEQETPTQQQTVQTQKVKVFPNPVTNVVNVLGVLNSAQATILVIDINGGVVLQRKWAIRNNAINIPVPNLNTGIYVIRIESSEQQVQTKFYKN